MRLIQDVKFLKRTEAEQALFNHIEVSLNYQRQHSTSGYKTPAPCKQEWLQMRKLAPLQFSFIVARSLLQTTIESLPD